MNAPRLDPRLPAGPVDQAWQRCLESLPLISPANRARLHLLVVGTGLAGASAAATLAERGYRVTVITYHDSPRRAHSVAAQGGINAARNYAGDGDSVSRLFRDTLKGGDFRAREAGCHRLAELSGAIIDQCVAQGVPFAREYGGTLANRNFGGSLVSRTFYARGQTGQQLLHGATAALLRQVEAGRVELRSRREMLELITVDGVARGVICLDLRSGALEEFYQIDPKDSWLIAAAEKNLPIFVPGWEDSTLGNVFAAHNIDGRLKTPSTMKSGIDLSHVADDIRPQDDLYRHFNGGWLRSAEIPADRPVDGSFYALRDSSEAAIREIVETAMASDAPAGSNERPCAKARAAPASTMKRPSGSRVPAIQRLRALRPSGAGRNQVQSAPFSSRDNGRSVLPIAIAIAQPAWVAIFAATNLVRIPPEEYPGGGSPPIASISGVRASTTGRCLAFGSLRGSAV